MENEMRYEALIAAVLVLSQIGASPANAEARDSAAPPQFSAASPQFSAAETGTVGRNELLRELIETDPWLVRQILDAVAERTAKDAAFDADAFVNTAFYTGGARAGSPEAKTAAASIELIELLRRVKDEKADKQGSKQSSGRSAKGSVELLESLKKARERKEKGGGK
jgi:hypothetical protein